MKDFKDIVKENKKRALSIAVATAFLISGPLGFTGCYDPQKDEEDEQEQNSYNGGGYSRGWHIFNRSSSKGTSSDGDSSINKNSSGNSKSSITNSSSGKSSGYSGAKGGSSSS